MCFYMLPLSKYSCNSFWNKLAWDTPNIMSYRAFPLIFLCKERRDLHGPKICSNFYWSLNLAKWKPQKATAYFLRTNDSSHIWCFGLFFMSWFHWRHFLWCFPFYYYYWWPWKRNIIHVKEVIHTHFLKVRVVTEAFEDGSSFQLSSTGCKKQKVIQGTLRTGVCCKDTQALGLERFWKPREIWGLAIISFLTGHMISCLWLLYSSMSICLLKIWPAMKLPGCWF